MIVVCGLIGLAALQPALAKEFTLYLLRHAQKTTESQDPGLTDNGLTQARHLATMLAHVPLTRIYSTAYRRTRQTVMPLAEHREIEVSHYDPQQLDNFASNLLERAENALIVGHSNTTPQLIEMLGGEAPDMTESDYADIYLLSFSDSGITSLRLVIP
ncbi:phosphoglycerate mutase family protein [Bowmanella dokdonensis]|uniref:Histidine phosphatase family protein n=1 Tax=Bowmanella dokdonensis TaxID=751969 RepID=A0A939DR53_9ALTE|nr:histidine phosphatase family protein [Bowmanella dokdonensis]